MNEEEEESFDEFISKAIPPLVKKHKFTPLPIPKECDYPHCYEQAIVTYKVAGIELHLCARHNTGTIDSGILVEIKKKKEAKKIERRGRRNQNRTQSRRS